MNADRKVIDKLLEGKMYTASEYALGVARSEGEDDFVVVLTILRVNNKKLKTPVVITLNSPEMVATFIADITKAASAIFDTDEVMNAIVAVMQKRIEEHEEVKD